MFNEMTGAELDPSLERAIVLIQHLSGILFIPFNILILLLIFLDDEALNKQYRKYLFCLQLSSLAFDAFSHVYAPIVMLNEGIVYSNSFLSNGISVRVFLAIELIFSNEVVLSYFACVYYRRGVILSPDRWFNFTGWRRKMLHFALQIYLAAVIGSQLLFMRKSLESPENFLPNELSWVAKKISYIFMRADSNLAYASFNPAGSLLYLIVFIMMGQLVFEVNNGMPKASLATIRYHRRAVQTLTLQGIIPSCTFAIPYYTNVCLRFVSTIIDHGESFDRFASMLSSFLWIIMTQHALANSITMLYCNPSYRLKILAVIRAITRKFRIIRVTPIGDEFSSDMGPN